MVVPVERLSRSEKQKRFVGNGLVLNLANNKIKLAVTGNNCKIKIEDNSGVIRIVGDRCDVTVLKGSANIDYVGNCGRIHLGVDVSENTVSYVGNKGEISTVRETSEERSDVGAEKTAKASHADNDGPHIVNLTNCSSIRLANSCIPSAINISIPTIPVVRFSRRGQRPGRTS